MQINNAICYYCIKLRNFSPQICFNGKRVEMGKFFPKSTDLDGFGAGEMEWNGLGPKIASHEGL